VKHNIEMAHRLSLLPGKCQQIHGHSWWVTLEIVGRVDPDTKILLDFAMVKAKFREYLDSQYDHRLLLNVNDDVIRSKLLDDGSYHIEHRLPGLQIINGDPTTELLAEVIGLWANGTFNVDPQGRNVLNRVINVEVWETSVNCATWTNAPHEHNPEAFKGRHLHAATE
jgi:6-pyruvoyltetrahydropterin/6-carboxytetrahydropterin synthase